jgi:hypothetical protein
LGNPTEDPHGDQFECKDKFENRKQLLSELAENQKGICVGEGYFIRVLEVLDKQNRFGF